MIVWIHRDKTCERLIENHRVLSTELQLGHRKVAQGYGTKRLVQRENPCLSVADARSSMYQRLNRSSWHLRNTAAGLTAFTSIPYLWPHLATRFDNVP